ncbi:AAA family ATPase [Leucobacter sp. HY1910]
MAVNPIARAQVTNFGPFASLDVTFSPHLNVIVGENGAGKSQLIKLLYSATAPLSQVEDERPTKARFNRALASKLRGVFRPDSLGRLTNRQQGHTRSEIRLQFNHIGALDFGFSTRSATEVQTAEVPDRYLSETPAFIPTRELLSIYPGLAALYDERVMEFDETWRDTAVLLGRGVRRGPREQTVQRVLAPIQEALGGAVVEESGRFYLSQPGLGKIEMHLVAEGFRKLGMIARLVASGTLLEGGYLFWDEPEANLNPKTLKQVAETIVELAQSGVQVFIATHSLFLLREIEMLTEQRALESVFVGLQRDDQGFVVAESDSSVEGIGDISALDAELAQSVRYLELT